MESTPNKVQKIQVHKMDDWFSGIYLKPMDAKLIRPHAYEENQPHRHDFYYIVLVDKGHMAIEVDFKPLSLSSQTIMLSYPGQIHQIRSADLDKGWFLAFDPKIINPKLPEILDQFLSDTIVMSIAGPQLAGLSSLISHLYEIYQHSGKMLKDQIIHALVNAVVFEFTSLYLENEQDGLTKHSVRNMEIARSFRLLARRDFRTMKSPSQYARKLNVTVSHLNDTVKKVTGFSVTHFIQSEVMREAQRQLFQTNFSIKEIADALGFEDEKYFSRLFSKIAGMPPGVFRKMSLVEFPPDTV